MATLDSPKLANKRVTCISALALILSLGCAPAYAQDDRYQSVFYPKGMPSKKEWDGKTRPTLYNYYADLQLPGIRAAVVLFSEQTITGTSDDLFTVFLGLAERSGNDVVSRTVLDITRYIPVQVEQPGNFYRMSGALNQFVAAPNVTAIHVNLWAVLSGSGSTGGGSDLFFGIDQASQSVFVPLLLLTGTSSFSRVAFDENIKKDVVLYLGHLNQDPMTEIIVVPREFEGQPIQEAEVYRFDGEKYRSMQVIPVTEVPRGFVRLQRSPAIAEIFRLVK